MENVVLERTTPTPLNREGLFALAAEVQWCADQNRVAHRNSYIALEGRRLVCVFQAPDVESVRRVSRHSSIPGGNMWAAAILDGPAAENTGEDAEVVVVERSFSEPAVFADLQAREDGGARCLEQHRVRFARTYFSADQRRMLCVYRAPDAESVRIAQKKIGMPFDAVWRALVV